MPLTVQALDFLVVQVSDVEVSAPWYERVLGMTREDVSPAAGEPPRTAMKFGRQKINLRPVALLTDATPDEAVRHLQTQGIAIVAGPGPRSGAVGRLMSVYCRDGSLIEIASCPGA